MNSEIKQRIKKLNKGEIPDGYKKTEFGVFPCDWVTDKKLQDIGTFGKGRGIPGNKMQPEGVPCVGYGDIYMKYNHFHFEEAQSFVDEETASDSQLIKKGTLLFTGTGETADEIGKCVCYNGEADIYAGGDIITFITQEVDPLFVAYQQYQSFSLKKKASFGQGHSVVHIQKENLEKLDVAYPPSLQEQSRIAQILMKWDEAIELYNRQIELLTQYKAVCLKKMFPSKGATVPEWRFKGFTDAWEQRKVSDVVNRFDNLRIPVAANLRIPGSTPYYGANGIQDYVEGFTHEGEFVLVAEDGANDLKNYPVRCVNGRIWVNNHAHVLQSKPEMADNKFLAYSISQADIEALLVGGGRAKLNAEVMMGIDLFLPSVQEQVVIGSYLTHLDHLITLHQRKFETIQHQRKVLQQYLLNGIVRVKHE